METLDKVKQLAASLGLITVEDKEEQDIVDKLDEAATEKAEKEQEQKEAESEGADALLSDMVKSVIFIEYKNKTDAFMKAIFEHVVEENKLVSEFDSKLEATVAGELASLLSKLKTSTEVITKQPSYQEAQEEGDGMKEMVKVINEIKDKNKRN